MSKHFRDFETYLSQHYGVEGFPLDWVVRPNLKPMFWVDLTSDDADRRGLHPDFFKFEETDHRCRVHAPIVPFDEAHHLRCSDDKVLAEWESDSRSHRRSDVFRRDDAIVFQLAPIAFADWPGEVHFIPRKGKVHESFPFKAVSQVEEPTPTFAPSSASVAMELHQLHLWMLLVMLMWLNPLLMVIFSHHLQLLLLGPPMIMNLLRLPHM